MEISKELLEKAKACDTADELIALAQENKFELSIDEAEYLLQELTEGELSDVELDNVAGGQEGCGSGKGPYKKRYWSRPEDVQFLFNINDTVECYVFGSFKNRTAGARVTNRRVDHYEDDYFDQYFTEKISGGGKAPLVSRWRSRDEIEQK